MLEEVELKQRNTVWPDTMLNGTNVDAFLWKGNPKATLVQRIGAVIFGLSFLLAAGMFAYLAEMKYRPLYLIAAPFAYVGIRVFANAFA